VTSTTDGPSPALVDAVFDSWLPGAMFPSELVWLGRLIRAGRIDHVIECGRQDGVSTWTLATLLDGSGVEISSIDFDDDPERVQRTKARLEGLPVRCVSGDIHAELPKLLQERRGERVAVVQDGPKGWEGMATLLAAAHDPRVALIAQHNLHLGHVSRTVFQMLALRPCFLEVAEAEDPQLTALRARESEEIPLRQPNRPVDHTSLGVIALDEPAREHLIRALAVVRSRLRPWDPIRVVAHWEKGDFGYCSRVRARSRLTPARFKQR
jgi:hypothetical protein